MIFITKTTCTKKSVCYKPSFQQRPSVYSCNQDHKTTECWKAHNLYHLSIDGYIHVCRNAVARSMTCVGPDCSLCLPPLQCSMWGNTGAVPQQCTRAMTFSVLTMKKPWRYGSKQAATHFTGITCSPSSSLSSLLACSVRLPCSLTFSRNNLHCLRFIETNIQDGWQGF